MNETPQQQQEFTIEDASRLIGSLVIDNDVLRRGLAKLRAEVEQAKKMVESIQQQRGKGPTLAVVERAEEQDASVPGQT